jgi:DNA invertase Pin-like site-specific DNA recombinase
MAAYAYARFSTDGQLAKAIDAMSKGDTLIVTISTDWHVGRDFLNTLDAMAEKSAGFKSLADVWVGTPTPPGRFTLAVLGGMAELMNVN